MSSLAVSKLTLNFQFDCFSRSIVRISNTGLSFSFDRQEMLTAPEHLVKSLFWPMSVYVKYYGIVNVHMIWLMMRSDNT